MEKDPTTVTIEIRLKASVEKVWKAWTDPAEIIRWFGSDPGGKGVSAALDVRLGGSFEVSFHDSDLTGHTCSGTYQEVQKFRKLTFTWHWKSEPGVESLVSVALSAEGDTTLMKFTHSRLGEGSGHNYQAGWESTFAKLRQLLEG